MIADSFSLQLQKRVKERTVELERTNRQMEQEIKDRKRAEQELKESEDRLKSFYGVAFEGIAITDHGKILDVNNRICEIYGFSREELIGSEVMNLVAEEDRELVLTNIKSGYNKPYEHKSVRKNGSEVIVEVHGQNIKYHGRSVRATIIHDITERKRTEEELQMEKGRLQHALAEIKTLKGIVPICSYCKKIRDDKGYWNQLEKYIHDRSDVEFSHGVCPECEKKFYSDLEIDD